MDAGAALRRVMYLLLRSAGLFSLEILHVALEALASTAINLLTLIMVVPRKPVVVGSAVV